MGLYPKPGPSDRGMVSVYLWGLPPASSGWDKLVCSLCPGDQEWGHSPPPHPTAELQGLKKSWGASSLSRGAEEGCIVPSPPSSPSLPLNAMLVPM